MAEELKTDVKTVRLRTIGSRKQRLTAESLEPIVKSYQPTFAVSEADCFPLDFLAAPGVVSSGFQAMPEN
jgi:hypothetical protein